MERHQTKFTFRIHPPTNSLASKHVETGHVNRRVQNRKLPSTANPATPSRSRSTALRVVGISRLFAHVVWRERFFSERDSNATAARGTSIECHSLPSFQDQIVLRGSSSTPSARAKREFTCTTIHAESRWTAIPNSELIVSGGLDKSIKLWETATGNYRATFRGHSGGVWGLAFSEDSRLFASASWDHTIRLWRAATKQDVDRTQW